MHTKIPEGALTALITPFDEHHIVDWKGLDRLIEFQVSQGISGIVPVGTTGESATLNEREHCQIISRSIEFKDTFVLAGCGSNCTQEALDYYVRQVSSDGGKAILMVDCYYNGPSSLELRNEYYAVIAKAYPDLTIVPYIIPGRTGCVLFPEDLALLNQYFPNICAVKEATGDLARMRKTRAFTSPEFQIFSGDDDKTFEMMTDPTINSCGVISVVSNIAPFAVQEMCKAILRKDLATAETIRSKLQPLFGLVTVLGQRQVEIKGSISIFTDKFRNPLPIKTAMNALGMPSGPCRQPLGKMSEAGLQKVRQVLASVWELDPGILMPIQYFFRVSISDRLADDAIWEKLAY